MKLLLTLDFLKGDLKEKVEVKFFVSAFPSERKNILLCRASVRFSAVTKNCNCKPTTRIFITYSLMVANRYKNDYNVKTS